MIPIIIYAIVRHADVCSDVPCGFAVVVGGWVFVLNCLSSRFDSDTIDTIPVDLEWDTVRS